MRWLREVWAKVPSTIRTILSYVFWLPVMLFVMVLIQVIVEDLGLGGAVGALAQLLIAAALLALTWYFFVRPGIDRSHGGAEKRRAYTSAIRTGVIGADADRERLKETARRYFAGRKYLWLLAAIGLGAFVGIPLAMVLLTPPIDSEDLFIVGSQLVIFLLLFIPVLLFHRRQSRQMAALKDALEADGPLPEEGLPG